MPSKTKPPDDIQEIIADWKDLDLLKEQFISAFKAFKIPVPKTLNKNIYACTNIDNLVEALIANFKSNGVNCYSMPSSEGSDTYGFFITRSKLNKMELLDLERY
jgi:hypothetical protein